MWINFSFLLILTTVPLPYFLCMTVLSTANVSNWVLRSISALLGAAEDVEIEINPADVRMEVFRASGAMDLLIMGIEKIVSIFTDETEFIGALPTAFMKPLSGSGAKAMMVEAMKTYGVDSFVGRLSCIFQGAADTTFYIIALYFGSVGIKKTRYAVSAGLIADLGGVIAAILIGYLFFA